MSKMDRKKIFFHPDNKLGRRHVNLYFLFYLVCSPEKSCMRPEAHVRFGSQTSAVMLRLRLTNTKNRQFTQLLPLGFELHIGKEHCCLRGIDQLHGPTFHSICGNLIIYEQSLKKPFIF
jgi:hypothetical protein